MNVFMSQLDIERVDFILAEFLLSTSLEHYELPPPQNLNCCILQFALIQIAYNYFFGSALTLFSYGSFLLALINFVIIPFGSSLR